jgi:hypothetical protein
MTGVAQYYLRRAGAMSENHLFFSLLPRAQFCEIKNSIPLKIFILLVREAYRVKSYGRAFSEGAAFLRCANFSRESSRSRQPRAF